MPRGLTNVRFVEGNFLELGQHWPEELGRFHYASAHGILSWIARPVREGLYACLDAALEPGALVYLSYNTLPGWISALPMQHLLRLWQVKEGLPSPEAIEQGRQRLVRLVEANAATVRALPGLKPRIEKLATQDKNYLIQEYLHDAWTLFWFDELAAELAPHKLNHVGTASASDWYLPGMLPAEWREQLNQQRDAIARETLLDVLINQSFRRDLWVRGQAPLWPARQREQLYNLRFVLLSRPSPKEEGANPFVYQTSLGEVQGKPEVYGPLYDALASGPKTVAELMAVPVAQGEANSSATRSLADSMQALGLMLHAGHVALMRGALVGQADKTAKALNRAIASAVLKGAPYKFLVAPAYPGVLNASDGDLMLLALSYGHKPQAEMLAQRWVEVLLALGRGLMRDGQPLTTREAMLPHATTLAERFLTQTLPQWQRLGIV
ncbi:MAG: methyltransferase regulatory domain-containing protein [Halomonas sp.]|nr:methyltransferase regulatory domain-containing protein [Halomonas sp.]MDM7480983.1 methyltransferase regulatory domain-containing protein [Halomonas sp.]